MLVLVTFGDAAPLVFAAGIIKGSTVFRGIYGLLGRTTFKNVFFLLEYLSILFLGIQPENIFTTEAPSFEDNFFDYINN